MLHSITVALIFSTGGDRWIRRDFWCFSD